MTNQNNETLCEALLKIAQAKPLTADECKALSQEITQLNQEKGRLKNDNQLLRSGINKATSKVTGILDYKALFEAAVRSIAEISVALGIPEEAASTANGNEEILAAIEELVHRFPRATDPLQDPANAEVIAAMRASPRPADEPNQDDRQTPAPSGHVGLGTAGGASSLHQPRAIVNEQAEDEGLWFLTPTASEAYLQQALRRLHAAVESSNEPVEQRTVPFSDYKGFHDGLMKIRWESTSLEEARLWASAALNRTAETAPAEPSEGAATCDWPRGQCCLLKSPAEPSERCLAANCGKPPMRAAFCEEHNEAIPLEDREDMLAVARLAAKSGEQPGHHCGKLKAECDDEFCPTHGQDIR